ncbi:hypothetical protein C354_06207 [Cryptococcus neoformans MW-RSA1955]|nr:hypothetical protein C354_06207 [Cryptococcus neoformans var. grubii MW-RSA1955]
MTDEREDMQDRWQSTRWERVGQVGEYTVGEGGTGGRIHSGRGWDRWENTRWERVGYGGGDAGRGVSLSGSSLDARRLKNAR